MATFEGGLQDFHLLVGPKIRNDVANLTKKKKNELKNICQHCSKQRELDAAHIHGRSRKDIVKLVLEKYKIDNDLYKIPDLHNVIGEIKKEQIPIEKSFYFLCKDCHKKYDTKGKIPQIREITENFITNPISDDTVTSNTIPKDGEAFTEKQLYEKFLVRNSGGIRPSTKNKMILLINSFFSEHMGGYKNHIDEKEGFVYHIGEGEGNQEFVRNNKSIHESKQNGYDMLYFEKPIQNKLFYKYQLEFDSWKHEMQVNSKGQNRQVIVFKLRII